MQCNCVKNLFRYIVRLLGTKVATDKSSGMNYNAVHAYSKKNTC